MATVNVQPIDNPLTETHYRDVNRALNRIARMKALLDKSESAGLPVGDLRAEIQAWEDRYNALKKEFWPTRS